MSKRSTDLAAAIGSHYTDPDDRRTKSEKQAAYRSAFGAGLTEDTRSLAEMVERNPSFPLTERQRLEVGTYLAYKNNRQANNEGDDQ